MKPPASHLTQGYLVCLIGTVLWSTTAIFIRYLTVTYNLPALVLAFWRDLTLAMALGTFFLLFRRSLLRLDPVHRRFILVYGLILSLFNSLWTISVALNGAAVSTVLAYSSAGFTAVLAWQLFGERLDWIKILAVMFSLAGCVFVSGALDLTAWQLNPLGVITGLSSGLAFAVYSLMGKEAAQRSINSWTALLYSFGVAAVLLFFYNQLTPWLPKGVSSTNLLWLGNAWTGWLVLAALAIGPTVGGYGLYMLSLNFLPASVANIIATLEPAMTGVQAFVLLGERFTAPQWIGTALIILGVIVLRISERRALASILPEAGEEKGKPNTLRIRYQGAIVEDSRLLLIRHTEHTGRSYWLLPGGGREPGESEEACVHREMMEETGLEVAVERLVLEERREVFFGEYRARTYLCRRLSGEPCPGYEPEPEAQAHYLITEVCWLDLNDEAHWDRIILHDSITYPQLRALKANLGYGTVGQVAGGIQ